MSDLANINLKENCSVDLVTTVRCGHGNFKGVVVYILLILRIHNYFTITDVQSHEVWDQTSGDVDNGSNGGCSAASSLTYSNLGRGNQGVSILSGMAHIELMSWNQFSSGVLILVCRWVIGDSITLTGGRGHNHFKVNHMGSMAWIVIQ